jgi:large conductance mechanosensitive channel
LSGFRKFLLQGNLIALATAVIIGGAFGTVVKSLVTVILDVIGKIGGTDCTTSETTGVCTPASFSSYQPGGVHVGDFLTALVAFVILAAAVYFLIIVPYTKAKERFFPDPEPGATAEDLLTEIRDLLAAQSKAQDSSARE